MFPGNLARRQGASACRQDVAELGNEKATNVRRSWVPNSFGHALSSLSALSAYLSVSLS
jgi:hypothetical protein